MAHIGSDEAPDTGTDMEQEIKDQLEEWRKLEHRFVREYPQTQEYTDRLAEELELITQQRFVPHFLRVMDVLELTKDIPHITRGSAGSSLICYLLGITDVDPVAEGIPLARFMNPYRDDLPDIDIDFPHRYHKEVMQRIYDHWPGRAARLSNYVRFRERTAKKEGLKRVVGHRGRIPKHVEIEKLVPKDKRAEWEKLVTKLEGKKRCISKHPGGIVVFDHAPAASLIRKDNQILLDKNECEDLALLKIDVLSNRGLTQLMDINGKTPFDYPGHDDATIELLARGDTIGVVQGESPVMRRTLRSLRISSKRDLIIAAALIRPAAVTGRTKGRFYREFLGHNRAPGDIKYEGGLIFDEDAIELIGKELGVDAYLADMYRRAFIKGNEEMMFDFLSKLGEHPRKSEMMELLTHMDGFGLCKAHAINLANLIWALAYEKVHNPKQFWLSALQNNNSMYRPWVHIEQAKAAGWEIAGRKRPWHVVDDRMLRDDKEWQVPWFDSHSDQMSRLKFWTHKDFVPGCYYTEFGDIATFCGMIAAHRIYCRGWHKGKRDYVTFVTIGTSSKQFHELVLPGLHPLDGIDLIEGSGTVEIYQNNLTIQARSFTKRKL